jgi:triacylglycerol lipase
MSFLVRLDESKYPAQALDKFMATAQFGLDNARAMMWLSQLAYETDDEPKVERILGRFQLKKLGLKTNDSATGLPPHSACVVIAEGPSATFVMFAGSDPGKFEDWVTDFDAMPSATGLHTGFQEAVKMVLPVIQAALAKRASPARPVFFTGHSLGGALAIVAASLVTIEPKVQVVVYTFGSPRTGDVKFFSEYEKDLGGSTFRLINGTDIVPTVPPSLSGGYRHVGRAIQCKTDGIFDLQTPTFSASENKPDLIESAMHSGIADLGAVATFQLIHGLGPGIFSQLTKLLPRMIRDHIPDNYFRALSIEIVR